MRNHVNGNLAWANGRKNLDVNALVTKKAPQKGFECFYVPPLLKKENEKNKWIRLPYLGKILAHLNKLLKFPNCVLILNCVRMRTRRRLSLEGMRS